MHETKILAAICKSRVCFELLDYELSEEDLGIEGMIVKEHVKDYYSRDDEAQEVDFELLSEAIGRSLASPKHREMFERILRNIEQVDVSSLNVTHSVLEAKRQAVAGELTLALTTQDKQKIDELIREYERLQDATGLDTEDSDHLQAYPVAELMAKEKSPENKIMVAPPQLNARLRGGATRGHNIIAIARPEVGKTALIVNMTRGFLSQGLKVLYLGNEDPIGDIYARLISSISGMTEDQIAQDSERAQRLAEAGNYANCIMRSIEPGSLRELMRLTKKYRPDVLIVDQLRHITTGDESKVQSLEAAAVGLRTIAKKYDCLCVTVSQAGESAAGKLFVTMEDLADNKTGVQGAMDLFIGLGCNDSYRQAGLRKLTLSKNKVGHVHDHFDVVIDESLSRIQ